MYLIEPFYNFRYTFYISHRIWIFKFLAVYLLFAYQAKTKGRIMFFFYIAISPRQHVVGRRINRGPLLIVEDLTYLLILFLCKNR